MRPGTTLPWEPTWSTDCGFVKGVDLGLSWTEQTQGPLPVSAQQVAKIHASPGALRSPKTELIDCMEEGDWELEMVHCHIIAPQ